MLVNNHNSARNTGVTEGVGEIGYLPVLENIKDRGFLRSPDSPAGGRRTMGSNPTRGANIVCQRIAIETVFW